MLSYLLAFITFVCSHAQCDPTQPHYSRNALTYWIQQYASQTQKQALELLQESPMQSPPQPQPQPQSDSSDNKK